MSSKSSTALCLAMLIGALPICRGLSQSVTAYQCTSDYVEVLDPPVITSENGMVRICIAGESSAVECQSVAEAIIKQGSKSIEERIVIAGQKQSAFSDTIEITQKDGKCMLAAFLTDKFFIRSSTTDEMEVVISGSVAVSEAISSSPSTAAAPTTASVPTTTAEQTVTPAEQTATAALAPTTVAATTEAPVTTSAMSTLAHAVSTTGSKNGRRHLRGVQSSTTDNTASFEVTVTLINADASALEAMHSLQPMHSLPATAVSAANGVYHIGVSVIAAFAIFL